MRNRQRKSEFRLPRLTSAVNQLVDEYLDRADQENHRWRAVMEKRIWNSISKSSKRNRRRTHFLDALVCQTATATQARCTLLRYESFCSTLWKLVDEKEISLSSAARMARGAVSLRRKNPAQYPTVEEAFAELLAEYNSRPLEIKLPDGTKVRRRGPLGRLPPVRQHLRNATDTGHARKGSSSNPPHSSRSSSPSRQLYQSIRRLFLDYATSELDAIDDEVAERIFEDFKVDIKLTIESIQRQISRHQNEQDAIKKLAETTLRRKLLDAFDTLCLPAPKVGEELAMERVKRAFRKHASLYHPDKTGDLDLTPRYREVVSAYEFICSVYESHQRENPTSHAT